MLVTLFFLQKNYSVHFNVVQTFYKCMSFTNTKFFASRNKSEEHAHVALLTAVKTSRPRFATAFQVKVCFLVATQPK